MILGAICVISGASHWRRWRPEESRAFYEKAVEQAKQGNARAAIIELKNALRK